MRHSTTMRRGAGLALVGAAALAPAASAATVSAPQAKVRACHARLAPAGAPGVDVTRVTATVDGLVQARLAGAGDWDLGVFDARTGRSVAGSAGFASNELAEGFVSKGQALVVQACRYRGDAGSASLRVGFDAVATGEDGERTQVVTCARRRGGPGAAGGLGVDLTEHGDATRWRSCCTAADGRVCAPGSPRTCASPTGRAQRGQSPGRRALRGGDGRQPPPVGRDSYRRLADYEREIERARAPIHTRAGDRARTTEHGGPR